MPTFSLPRTPDALSREYLAELALQGVTDGEARDPIVIWHCPVDVQECLRSITALLSIHAHNPETGAVVQVVVESDTLGEIGAGVESAGALVVIDGGSSEGVFEDPVGAGLGFLEAGADTVAGGVDAIFVVEIDHGHDTSDINAREVADAATIIRRGLQLRELALGDLSLADGVVVVVISRWENVDVGVVIVAIVTTILTKWPSKD
jgi:hypothetical protein